MPPDTGRLTFREMASGDLGDMAALQGRGYATEAAAACRDYARTALGASRLIAIIHPDNRPSQRVAEKIGLRPEKRSLVHGGREAVIYAGSL